MPGAPAGSCLEDEDVGGLATVGDAVDLAVARL